MTKEVESENQMARFARSRLMFEIQVVRSGKGSSEIAVGMLLDVHDRASSDRV
jgi:hypothetical protein